MRTRIGTEGPFICFILWVETAGRRKIRLLIYNRCDFQIRWKLHTHYPIDFQIKLEIEMETMSLTIPVNSQIKSDSYLYIYLLLYSTGKGHEQSIYSKAPLLCYLGKPESNSTQDQCMVIQQVLFYIESN